MIISRKTRPIRASFRGTKNQAVMIAASSVSKLQRAYPNYFADTVPFHGCTKTGKPGVSLDWFNMLYQVLRGQVGPLRLSFSRFAASPAIWARVRACSEAPGDNARPIGSPTLRTSPKWTSVELPSCWSAFRPCGDSRRRPGTPEGICAAAIWNLAHEILANVVASTASPTWNIALGVVQWTPRLWSDLDHSRAFCER